VAQQWPARGPGADAVCCAEYGKVTSERVNRRNGYRLLERRKRAEWYLLGVSTRRSFGIATSRVHSGK
jgi:hypothetical protein